MLGVRLDLVTRSSSSPFLLSCADFSSFLTHIFFRIISRFLLLAGWPNSHKHADALHSVVCCWLPTMRHGWVLLHWIATWFKDIYARGTSFPGAGISGDAEKNEKKTKKNYPFRPCGEIREMETWTVTFKNILLYLWSSLLCHRIVSRGL